MKFFIYNASQHDFRYDTMYKFENNHPCPHEKAVWNKEFKNWEIDIDTVEELVNLYEDGVIVCPSDSEHPFPTITIYDGFIE